MVIINSRDYLLKHLEEIKASVKVKSVPDRENLAKLEEELESLAKRHKNLGRFRIAVFVFLYASVVSNLALPALTTIVEKFTLIANLIGVGLLSLAALYLTWRMAQLWNRMVIIGGHVISIYEKHNKERYRIGSEDGVMANLKKRISSKNK